MKISHSVENHAFRKLKIVLATLTALTLTSPNMQAAVLSTDPGDMVALPVGTELGVFYYQHAERNKLKKDGHTVTKNFGLDDDIAVARYVHWTEIGGLTVTPQIIVPFGHLKLSGSSNQSASGIGDPIIGAMVWPINDPARERWLNMGGYVGVPVGNHDPDRGAINIGENRWKAIFQVGYVQAIIPKTLYGEITLESDNYGKNDDFAGSTLKQDSIFETTFHLRYVLNAKNQLGLTYYHTVGGENEVDNFDQNDSLNRRRGMLTWQHFFTTTTQFQTQFAKDLDVRNGPEERYRIQFRLAHAF